MDKFIISAFVIALLVGCSGKKKKADTPTRKSVLIGMAKKETLTRLKSPSTAVFIDSLSSVIRLKGEKGLSNSYRVSLSVDAKNSFGTTLRESYMLIYEYSGTDSLSKKSYELENFYD